MAETLKMAPEYDSWRDDFPIFQTRMNGKPLVYLDSAASAQKPNVVINKISDIMISKYSNIHRGLYSISQELSEEYESVRGKLKSFLNIQNSDYEVVFTRNTTEAINLVAQSWGGAFLQAGDEIILSEMEHHANIVPWHLLNNNKDIIIKFIPVLDNCTLDLDAYSTLLSEKTRLITITHTSNSLGTINPVKEMIKTARAFNPDIKILIDGSQAVVHGAVDLSDLDADFYAFTGHKLYGPTGIGVLIAKKNLLEKMRPYQGGGDMIESVTLENSTYKTGAHKFEAGTPAIIEVLGLGAAVDYLVDKDMNKIAAHEQDLLQYATARLSEIDGIQIYGTAAQKAPILSFTADWGHISDIAMILDQCGVAVRSGHHCCMPLMQRFGIEGTIRASFGLYNTRNDINIFIEGLQKARKMLS